MPIRFSCECGKQLAVKDELAGRRARCPDCQTILTIPTPKGNGSATPRPAPRTRGEPPAETRVRASAPMNKRPRPADDYDDEDEDDDGDEDDEDERPARRGKGRKKRQQGASPVLLLSVGGGAIGLLLIGLLVWFLWPSGSGLGGIGGGGAPPSHLHLIPGDADGFASVQVARLWEKAPQQIKDVMDKLPGPTGKTAMEEMREKAGLEVGDIERVTVVFSAPAGQGGPRPGAFPFAGTPDVVSLISTRKPFDQPKVLQEICGPNAQEQGAGSKIYPQKNTPNMYVKFIDDTTLVSGPLNRVQQIGQGGGPAAGGAIAKGVDLARQHMFAAVGQVPQSLRDQMNGQMVPPQFQFATRVQAASATLDFETDLNMKVSVDFADAQSPQDALNAFNQSRAGFQTMLGLQVQQAHAAAARNPNPEAQATAAMLQAVSDSFNTLNPQVNGNSLDVSVTVSGTIIQQAAKQLEGATGNIQDAARKAQSANNLKQIALAMHSFHDANRNLPPQIIGGGLSWRVAILPYVEQGNLYKEFKLNEPWNSPHNLQLVSRMPKIYELPGAQAQPGHTFYQGFNGKGSVLEPRQKISLTGITDGTSNTFMVAEAATAVPWTKPDDIPFNPQGPFPRLGGHFGGGGFHAAFCDGSVRFLRDGIPDQTLRNAVIRNDGQPINLP